MNEKIRESWDKINPSAEDKKRMEEIILQRSKHQFKRTAMPQLRLVMGVMAIVLIGTVLYQFNLKMHEGKDLPLNNHIYFNQTQSAAQLALDIDGKAIRFKNNLLDKIVELKFNLPYDVSLKSGHGLYVKENRDKGYSLLRQIELRYDIEGRSMDLMMSDIDKPLTCIMIDTHNKKSVINGVELMITQYKDNFELTFKKDNIYCDMTLSGWTQDEVLILLDGLFSVNLDQVYHQLKALI